MLCSGVHASGFVLAFGVHYFRPSAIPTCQPPPTQGASRFALPSCWLGPHPPPKGAPFLTRATHPHAAPPPVQQRARGQRRALRAPRPLCSRARIGPQIFWRSHDGHARRNRRGIKPRNLPVRLLIRLPLQTPLTASRVRIGTQKFRRYRFGTKQIRSQCVFNSESGYGTSPHVIAVPSVPE